jgi:hypothetical protein
MAAEQSDLGRLAAEMTERLRGIQAIQEQFVAAVHQIQDVILFGDHPELTALDDELDILYRGQL